ncbi:MAG: hypothetical protein FJ197_13065 [Gammaproteobacteria bacterium]|nr:hypothetical protein [Gammaproteobacteria bacterium]
MKNQTNQTLGTLRAVEPRTMWPDEAADFTPWLAREENILALGRAIGLELEVEHTEMAVGPFAADILARDSAIGNYVIIENQLAKTNHDHLGKAITYAAFLGASTIVWVAPAFTDEHRKALDWLNDNSVDTLSFFGVQVELGRVCQVVEKFRRVIIRRDVTTLPSSPPSYLDSHQALAA